MLLRDSGIYDTQTLTRETNWRYDWADMDASALWQLTEINVPEGYTAEVHREGNLFIVINTKEGAGGTSGDGGSDAGSDDGTGNDSDSGFGAGTPSVPVPSDGTSPASKTEEKLPQTGQLWWPVPLLFCGGAFLYALGLILSRRDHDRK